MDSPDQLLALAAGGVAGFLLGRFLAKRRKAPSMWMTIIALSLVLAISYTVTLSLGVNDVWDSVVLPGAVGLAAGVTIYIGRAINRLNS